MRLLMETAWTVILRGHPSHRRSSRLQEKRLHLYSVKRRILNAVFTTRGNTSNLT